MNSRASKLNKKQDTDKNAAPPPATIEAAPLAHLAAQPRFAHLPTKDAADAALRLFDESQAALTRKSKRENGKQPQIPTPLQWPASLDDFYKLIVKGKDETDNQPRFKKFLRHQIDAEEKAKVVNLAEDRERLDNINRTRTADAKACRRPTRQSGTITRTHFARKLKLSIAQREANLLTNEEERDNERDRRFEHYRTSGINRCEWLGSRLYRSVAEAYLTWWMHEITAKKRKAGLARAKAYAANQKRISKEK